MTYDPAAPCNLFTIGHSSNTIDEFVARLKKNGVTILVDVRSVPYSRFQAQFNREPLSQALHHAGIDYYYGGNVLGGKSDRSVKDPEFQAKIARVVQLSATEGKAAMMCAEKNPAECHRASKLSAWLLRTPTPPTIRHILADGSTIDAKAFEEKMPSTYGWWEIFPEGQYGRPKPADPQGGLF